jgi:ribosome biogenesis protein MAK21
MFDISFKNQVENDEIDKNVDNIFKIVHISPFNVSIQALALLSQVKDSREDIEDRFYSAFYRRIFHLEWRNTSKQTYFLKLLYESMSKDQSINRKKAFVKRILQICFSQNVSFVTASLMIVSELMSEKKEDLMQLDHAILVKNGLLNSNGSKFNDQEDDDDEDENFVDEKTSDEEEKKQIEPKNKKKESKENKKMSWIHKNNVVFKRHTSYDFNERNPMYAGAEKTLTYELLALSRHYHPTVALFATKLLNVNHFFIVSYVFL